MELDKKLKSKLVKAGQIALAVFLLIDLVLHYKSAHNTLQIPLPAVVIQKPELKSMVEYVTQTGNTVAFNSVDLVARIKGYLDTISFVDGTFLKKGQPLFVIEPQPYLDQLLVAKATVAAQKAALTYAKEEYARQKRMYRENATSLNNVQKWLAKSLEAEANVASAVANEDNAAINYSYTQIKAPFDGRIGRHLVDAGNLVGNGAATKLATIDQLDPIYVYFNLNELDLLKLRAAARANGYDSKKISQVPVHVGLQNNPDYQFDGKLDFVNTGLNASTGTMEFRALLPNKQHMLVPGLFVQVRVAITKPAKQLTVPDTALLYDQIGAYLLTVDNNNTVVLKRVETGTQEQGRRAILKGLDAGDNVIVSGIQNATPGNQVSPKEEKTDLSSSKNRGVRAS